MSYFPVTRLHSELSEGCGYLSTTHTYCLSFYNDHLLGSKLHDTQSATSNGLTTSSFNMPPVRNNHYTGSLVSSSGHTNQDLTKLNELKRESALSQKTVDKRPRKIRPAKKKGEDGPVTQSSSGTGPWVDGVKPEWVEGTAQPEGAVVGEAVGASGEADTKIKVKRKYVRPAKQKVDSTGNPMENSAPRDPSQGGGAEVPGGGSNGDGKVELKTEDKEEGAEEGDEDAASGAKRKRDNNGRGSRGGKARVTGRGLKALSSPNTAKRMKAGSPLFDGSAPAEGGAFVKEEVSMRFILSVYHYEVNL